MIKLASFASTFKNHPGKHIVGFTLGGIYGAALGSRVGTHTDKKGKKRRGSAAGAIVGGIAGAGLGVGAAHFAGKSSDHFYENFRGGRWNSGYAPPPRPKAPKSDNPFMVKSFKTKKDATAHWKELARQHHPDLGGSTEKMREINAHWDDFKQSRHFEKLAMMIKLAKKICIDSSHLKEDGENLKKIKKTVVEMQKDDKKEKK